MKTTINPEDAKALVASLGGCLIENSARLAELDAVMGDGDLGVTVTIAFRAVAKLIKKGGFDSIADLLGKCSELIGEEAPSTFGTLLSGMFAGAAESLDETQAAGAAEFAGALEAAAARVMQIGKANRGDKTLLDALIPASEAARAAVAGGGSLAQAAEAAAEAADNGAKDTVGMHSKTGRALYLGERAVGAMDPGAAAVAMMLETVRDFIK